jgi:hypothetical protein
MWWSVDVGFSHSLDEKNATQVQKKCLHLNCQSTNIFYQSMKDNIFGEIMYMKTAHDIWLYLNLIYGRVSNNDDDEAPKEEAHECVEHDHNLVIMEDCSPHGQVMMMKDLPQVHLTRLMMMPQVMQMMMLPHAHLMMMIVHAQMILLQQAL